MPAHPPENALNCITINCSIFGFEENSLKILLVRRNIMPSKGTWELPGGWIMEDEDMDDAARRVLEEATGVKDIFMEQQRSFGRVDRFPLRRIITISYYALIKPENYILKHGPDVSDVRWFDYREVPTLSFDHNEIVENAYRGLQKRVRQAPVGFELLPQKFTLTELQSLYEAILDISLNKRNFRKKLLKMHLLHELHEWQQGVSHRPARLYTFDQEHYERLKAQGFVFDL
jgi:ADP-ribose pyrophosphatase YjhB (NUDIX family)